jgi:hypothetical protein
MVPSGSPLLLKLLHPRSQLERRMNINSAFGLCRCRLRRLQQRIGAVLLEDGEPSIDMHDNVLGAGGLIVRATALLQRSSFNYNDRALGR